MAENKDAPQGNEEDKGNTPKGQDSKGDQTPTGDNQEGDKGGDNATPDNPAEAATKAVQDAMKGFQEQVNTQIKEIDEKNEKRYAFMRRKSKGKGKASPDDEGANEGATTEALQDALKVATGIANLVTGNADYQKVISKDKTLQRVIAKNPLAILEEDDFSSPEDAIESFQDFMDELVMESLGKKKDDKKKDDKKDDKKEDKPAQPNNSQGQGDVGKKEEKKEDNPKKSTVDKVADSILKRVKTK